MTKMIKNVKGAALVEYGILVGLIAVVAIAAVTLLGEQVTAVFSSVTSSLDGVGSAN